MQKKKIFKIADSNVEGIGTENDKKLRESAASTEKAWKKIKKKPGLNTWRIEKFKVKKNPDAKNGIFYNDDSYIVLNGYLNENDKLLWDVHFWLGETTSQDEAGTAAYKTVELDDFLGGDPVQHREVSGHESSMFLGYFPQGIRLLNGGVESGFNHITPEAYETRLLWIKGNKNIRVVQVEIKVSSLNSGDVFLLDTGMVIYQYQAKGAGKNEKHQAGKLGQMIDDERRGKPERLYFSQSDKVDDTMQMFFSYFQDDLKGEDIKEGTEVPVEKCEELLAAIPTSSGGCDEEWEQKSDKVLLQLSDASGELTFTEVAKKTIPRSALDSNDVFVFDIGSEIFVWIGKDASTTERSKGMHFAGKYLNDYDRPAFLPVTQIFEGGENEVFEGCFDS